MLTAKANDLKNYTPEPVLTYRLVDRERWNVLDLLKYFGTTAITTHIFYDINMDWVVKKRNQYKEAGKSATITAFLLKAIAIAQKNHPMSRTLRLPGMKMVTFNEIVAGFTIERSVNNKPVVFFGEIENPDTISLQDMASQLKVYAEDDIDSVPKLKQQVLFTKLPWLLRQLVFNLAAFIPGFRLLCMKATFGLSSLGALGVQSVFGPSVCTSVFGVGALEERAVVQENEIVARHMMTISLSFNQRILDAGQAALFVKEVKNLLEGELENYLED